MGLCDYTERRIVAFRVPGMDVETYILPEFTISEDAGARARTKRAYSLKVDAFEHTAAMAYHDSLSNANLPPAYASTDAMKKALGAYNMIKRVTQDDVAGLPPTITAHMTKQRWRCNCLEFMRRVQCEHALFGQFIDDPASKKFRAETLLETRWCRPRNVRKKELPGMRWKPRATEEMHFMTYLSIDKVERRKLKQ